MIRGYGYHPATHTPEGYLRGGNRRAPAVARLSPAAPIETRDFHILLVQARAGDKAAQSELRARGNRTTRA